MNRKTLDLIDSTAEATGEVTAYASVFGNVDSVGDRVMPGAFTETLATFRAKGREIPIVAAHKSDDPWSIIGSAPPDRVRETSRGLLVEGRLDIEDNPLAKQVHKLMARGNLTAWSFGYTVPKDGQRRGKDGANEIFKVDLFEVGPCLVGANREAELVGVKTRSQPPAFDRVAKDRELEELLAEIEARKAKEAKASRPIRVHTFEV